MDLPPQQPPSFGPPAQPEQKSNTGKIIVIVVAVVACLCLVSCAVGALLFQRIGSAVSGAVEMDPQEVSSAIDKVASIEVPANFKPGTSMDLLGMTFVLYEGTDGQSGMVVLQMPAAMELNDANIRQLEEQLERQSGRNLDNFKVIDQYDTTIRGEPGKVIVQEGTSEGADFRQMLVIFQGRSGMAMLSILGPTSSWDQDAYDRMVQSIE